MPPLSLRFVQLLLGLCTLMPSLAAAQSPAHYHVARTLSLGGDGGWDYLTLDTATHRLFIGRSNRVMVVDPAKGTVLGEIPGLTGAHGVAIDHATGHGFATSGRDSTVVMFDLASLKVLNRTIAGDDADAILYDPASKRVFTFNGDANTASAIDPATGARIGVIPLGGKPEFAVSTGTGTLFANIEDTGEIVEIDPRAMQVRRRWSIAPCEDPTGLALDRDHQRLFSGCRNRLMAISDASAGKLITTLPIGGGVDGNAFDPASGNAFSSNGDGTLTVVHEDSPDRFHVAETVQTAPGARTITIDPRTHALYTVSAKFGPAPAESTAANPRRRPPILPGTFMLLIVEP